jgi:hypothetical protein
VYTHEDTVRVLTALLVFFLGDFRHCKWAGLSACTAACIPLHQLTLYCVMHTLRWVSSKRCTAWVGLCQLRGVALLGFAVL